MSLGKQLKLTCVGCSAVAVLGVVSCAALLYVGYRSTDQHVSPIVDALFDAIDEGAFEETYDTLASPQMRGVTSREDYGKLGLVISRTLGRLRSKSLRSFEVRQLNTDSFVSATYNARFEKGAGTIFVEIVGVGDGWKVSTFRVESPVFLDEFATEDDAEQAEDEPESPAGPEPLALGDSRGRVLRVAFRSAGTSGPTPPA